MNNNNSSQSPKRRKNPKRKRKQQQKSKPSNIPKARGHLSPCAQKYLIALTNPFARIDEPCIPDSNTLPSQKFSIRATGSLTIGTNGYGFVTVSPRRYGNDFASGFEPIWYTTSTYAGSSISYNTGSAGVAHNNMGRFPYPESDFSVQGKKIRTVGAGVRIFYTGTELNRGGTIFAFRTPNNSSANSLGTTEIANLSTTKILPVDRKKHAVCYKPSDPVEFAYSETSGNFSQNSSANYGTDFGPASMGFLIQSTAANTFNFEYVAHYECIGSTLLSSPSESDANGLSAIFTALPTVIETATDILTGNTWKGAYKALESMSGLYFGVGPPPLPPLSYTIEEL